MSNRLTLTDRLGMEQARYGRQPEVRYLVHTEQSDLDQLLRRTLQDVQKGNYNPTLIRLLIELILRILARNRYSGRVIFDDPRGKIIRKDPDLADWYNHWKDRSYDRKDHIYERDRKDERRNRHNKGKKKYHVQSSGLTHTSKDVMAPEDMMTSEDMMVKIIVVIKDKEGKEKEFIIDMDKLKNKPQEYTNEIVKMFEKDDDQGMNMNDIMKKNFIMKYFISKQ